MATVFVRKVGEKSGGKVSTFYDILEFIYIIINNFTGMTCTGIAKVLSRNDIKSTVYLIILNKCYEYCVVLKSICTKAPVSKAETFWNKARK